MSITSIEQLKSIESWSTRKTPVVCVNVIDETHDVKTFQFRAKEPQLFHFKPGQFIGIQLEIGGEKHNRSYTIASSPTRPHLLELTIKKDPEGIISSWLHENIQVGSELEFRGPAGQFNCLDIESDKVVLISAGSGITPAMSMLRFWCDQAVNKNIVFLHWARTTQDIIFRRELSLLDFQHANCTIEVVCSQPGLTENWLGRRGRVNKNILLDVVPDIQERVIFCCGPDGFMDQVKQSLGQLDFNMENYHDETFDPGGKKKAKLEKQQAEQQQAPEEAVKLFKLTLKKSGITVDVTTQDALLEKIESTGVAIESACREGDCGCCKVRKISGDTVTTNDSGLDKQSEQEGFILTCTSHVRSDVELDI
ncbi:FAD-binding oxidoreductase [Aliikangiella maris]|uniref:Hybrid-cluster NAD(P)-dependent oxidoreductase n=2 Tax=Aliikangiella maris TaxID=3162458 RepID=A0ABV2BX29_9GAMM